MRSFCQKLIALGKQRKGFPWNLRRLAILILENQILKLDPERSKDFRFVTGPTQAQIAPASIVRSRSRCSRKVIRRLTCGGSFRSFAANSRDSIAFTTRLRVIELRRSALRDFIDLSRQHCKLSLARYLFTPEEIVGEILRKCAILTV